MPHDLLPVSRQRVGGNKRDNFAEANTYKRTDIRKANRAHSKVLRIFKHLNKYRAFGFKAVFCGERIPALFKQWLEIRPENLSIFLG